MIRLLNILILVVTLLFGLAFSPGLFTGGVAPLLPLFFIISLTYFSKGFEPLLLAALTGGFLDLFSAYSFGYYLAIFLGVAVLVRLLFQEGMRELTFGTYAAITGTVLAVNFIVQLVILNYMGVGPDFLVILKQFVAYASVNGLFLIFAYVFNVWYFDHVKAIEAYQRRR